MYVSSFMGFRLEEACSYHWLWILVVTTADTCSYHWLWILVVTTDCTDTCTVTMVTDTNAVTDIPSHLRSVLPQQNSQKDNSSIEPQDEPHTKECL